MSCLLGTKIRVQNIQQTNSSQRSGRKTGSQPGWTASRSPSQRPSAIKSKVWARPGARTRRRPVQSSLLLGRPKGRTQKRSCSLRAESVTYAQTRTTRNVPILNSACPAAFAPENYKHQANGSGAQRHGQATTLRIVIPRRLDAACSITH